MPEQHIDNEKIPTRLIGAIVAVGSLAFIGILTETVMTVLFPALMREFHVDTATVQWITTIYLLAVAATMPISSFLKRRFALKTIFLAAVILAIVGSLIMIVAQAVDDQHHSGAVSSFENRPIDGRRIAGHYRGSGHRPDRRRRGDHSAAVARDFRHRHSAGANRSMHRHEVH